ncbi:hypothetical protein M422DRAFT_171092 [Sphaerobolus stellatus SS14]|uniref:Uncharacterized protein n=1 Tax=Sphaerobolus stellatus (strain SS14) TaxID=990650 RepID=A0A0C9V662_SPHS4|nr:hypothetical protein M422DRAFT_171092 [Sphaerobolus stellatus SS14]
MWKACRIKVLEIATALCGVPLTWTKFARAESETNIIAFIEDSWPTPQSRPSYIGLDKGCKTLRTMLNDPTKAALVQLFRMIVPPFHYNGHANDPLCVRHCNPRNLHDPNLVRVCPTIEELDMLIPHNAQGTGARAVSRHICGRMCGRELSSSKNFEISEQFNADIAPYKATLSKMRPDNHDFLINVILSVHAQN